MVRINLLKNKAQKQDLTQLHKAEMIFTAVVAFALVIMIFLPN